MMETTETKNMIEQLKKLIEKATPFEFELFYLRLVAEKQKRVANRQLKGD